MFVLADMQAFPRTREAILHEGLKTFEQRTTDREWVKNWIEKRRIPLSIYRQKLIEHSQLLQQYEQALSDSNTERLNPLKIAIEKNNQWIYDERNIHCIQKQIYRRKLKRNRLRRQKQVPDEPMQPAADEEKTWKEKIDEIKSLLQTISQLKTSHPSDELTEIERLCTEKLHEYQTDLPLTNYLFNNQNQSFYQATSSAAQYYLRAHENRHDLIQIRQAWDHYSTARFLSSAHLLPNHWHEPQLPSDSNWSQFLSNQESLSESNS